MAAESLQQNITTMKWQASLTNKTTRTQTRFTCSSSASNNDKVFKELGLFALRRKIEDAVIQVEMLTPPALKVEEERRIQREGELRDQNLWDDPVESSEMLANVADSSQLVDSLIDLSHKIEEVKLITELAETDAVNYPLFKQAYSNLADATKFLNKYEISKLLTGIHDMHGASLVIKAGDTVTFSEMWADRLVSMYLKWAEKLGQKGRILERCSTRNEGIKSVTIDLEFKYAYGYLVGEMGTHTLIGSPGGSEFHEAIAAVDVIPLFLEKVSDISVNDEDLIISDSSLNDNGSVASAVQIRHAPTGICVQSSGERTKFGNKMKAINRLKAKIQVLMSEQGVSCVSSIKADDIIDVWEQEARRYNLQPKLVKDVKTGVQLSDLNSVLNGNINQLIGAHIRLRHSTGMG